MAEDGAGAVAEGGSIGVGVGGGGGEGGFAAWGVGTLVGGLRGVRGMRDVTGWLGRNGSDGRAVVVRWRFVVVPARHASAFAEGVPHVSNAGYEAASAGVVVWMGALLGEDANNWRAGVPALAVEGIGKVACCCALLVCRVAG